MLKHIVMFKFKDTANGKTKAENLLEAKKRLLYLKSVIPEIVELTVNLGSKGIDDSNYDFILDSTFKNAEDLERYANHPDHLAFGKFLGGVRAEGGRACIDYEI